MADRWSFHQRKLDLLAGPAIEITVKGQHDIDTWTLPVALLCRHSGYFKRLQNFKEGKEGKLVLEQFEPKTFKLFVEFIYCGRIPLSEFSRFPESTKAWVLGDYLDATEFKNHAMQDLFELYYHPTHPLHQLPLSPSTIEYCWENSLPESRFRKLYLSIAVKYWSEGLEILYDFTNDQAWSDIWNQYPEFRDELLRTLCRKDLVKKACSLSLDELLEPLNTEKRESQNKAADQRPLLPKHSPGQTRGHGDILLG